jgi:transposase-like protein
MQVTDARCLSSEAQEALRKRAVQAILEGRIHQETAQLFGVTRGTVTRWMGLYQEEGEVGLNARTKGRSSHPALGIEEAALGVKLVIHLGLPIGKDLRQEREDPSSTQKCPDVVQRFFHAGRSAMPPPDFVIY